MVRNLKKCTVTKLKSYSQKLMILLSGMWNKPSRSHSPVSPNIYRSPTLVKANFTPPTSPPPKEQNTRPPPHSPHRTSNNPHPQLRSKTPGKSKGSSFSSPVPSPVQSPVQSPVPRSVHLVYREIQRLVQRHGAVPNEKGQRVLILIECFK